MEFSFFRKFNNLKDLKSYAKKEYSIIGSGSSRVVYDIGNERVLKIAKSKRGMAQNSVESKFILHSKYDNIITNVYDSDPNGMWVECDYAEPIKEKDFKEIVGYSFNKFKRFVESYYKKEKGKRHNESVLSDYSHISFFVNVSNMVVDFNLSRGDIKRITSFGKIVKDGKETVVVSDYGLSESVKKEYY